MHPDDERDFVSHVLSDDRTFLIDERSSDPAGPLLLRSIDAIAGGRCGIFRQPGGAGTNGDGGSGASGTKKIQFLRSQIVGTLITEGSIAIGTDRDDGEAAGVERHYKSLSKFIKARYANSVLRWYNPNLPFAPAAPGRSVNPGGPAPQVWVGPSVRPWLAGDPERRIRQHWSYGAMAFLE
ncbi:hypothetical protein CYK37_26230 [Mesorhizobium loti]|nr:hypothetical protein CYK37_26230 [Mesorhizobium loti]